MPPSPSTNQNKQPFWNPKELGHPKVFFPCDSDGWRWYLCYGRGQLETDAITYHTKNEAREACTLHRIESILHTAYHNERSHDDDDIEPELKQFKLRQSDLDPLLAFVRQRLKRK